MKKILLIFLIITGSSISKGLTDPDSLYNPWDLYLPIFNPPAGNEFRSASGLPGPEYWQNSADYLIDVSLNEKDTVISGNVTIVYTNNSPDNLDYLWLQLDQNIFEPASRSAATTPYPGDEFGVLGKIDGGYRIKEVTITQGEKSYSVKPVITDTRMQIRLKKAMKPEGDLISIKIDYSFVIPADGAGRFGRMFTGNGLIYQIAQWYPRMCVYDDVEGWNTLPYLGVGEYYCDYGDYEYYITAPADMIIFGSGDLQNPEDVLTRHQINRLAEASKSDQTIAIIDAAEAGKPVSRPVDEGNLRWHYKIKNARDVAFTAAKGVIWDAARLKLPSGRKALAMSCYPPESAGDTAWSRATEYLKAAIEIYSENYFEYPWNYAVNSAGITGGMEYPGIIFNDYKEKKAGLWFLISHEIGHNWFPMIVGSNERKYMWLDEGLNTYINYIANDIFNNCEYQTDSVYYAKEFYASRDYEQFMQYKDPLMILTDAMDVDQHYQFYGKTAYGLNLLRTIVVCRERFDYAFRKFTEAWAFKHPTPYDFFRCINNATGEDLNWFWNEWFFTTWKLDQAIVDVSYINENPAEGVLITIGNNGRMIMPLILCIYQDNGKAETVRLPIEIWQRGGEWTFKFESESKLKKIVLDPEKQLPDINRSNNEWIPEE